VYLGRPYPKQKPEHHNARQLLSDNEALSTLPRHISYHYFLSTIGFMQLD